VTDSSLSRDPPRGSAFEKSGSSPPQPGGFLSSSLPPWGVLAGGGGELFELPKEDVVAALSLEEAFPENLHVFWDRLSPNFTIRSSDKRTQRINRMGSLRIGLPSFGELPREQATFSEKSRRRSPREKIPRRGLRSPPGNELPRTSRYLKWLDS